MILEYNIINSFQILNNRPQEVSSINNNQRQASVKIEETVVEDARFPEQGAKEIIIKDGTVTQISGGQYNGFIQVVYTCFSYLRRSITRKDLRRNVCLSCQSYS